MDFTNEEYEVNAERDEELCRERSHLVRDARVCDGETKAVLWGIADQIGAADSVVLDAKLLAKEWSLSAEVVRNGIANLKQSKLISQDENQETTVDWEAVRKLGR